MKIATAMFARAMLCAACLLVVTRACAADAAAPTRHVLTLDGRWQIVADAKNVGKSEGWQRPAMLARQAAVPIPVPSCWEETLEDYEGVAWYVQRFVPPKAWQGKHIRLCFAAVNYIAEVWLNGQVAGAHEGGYTPFELPVTDLLKLGEENVLVVRVVGPAIVRPSVDGLVRDEAPHWRGAYVGGIWQSVRLEASEPLLVRDVFVEPKLEQAEAVVHVDLGQMLLEPRRAEAVITIAPADQPEHVVAQAKREISLEPCLHHELSESLKIPSPQAWSPEEPSLYVARVELASGGRTIDSREVRFGMRAFTIRGGDFYLNGKRIFIKGAFWEGFYPATLAHPRDPEIVRREIRLAKQAGFNLLRPWRMPPVPLTLDLADEMGILLIGSPPIECMGFWPADTPQFGARWRREMREMVCRDRNHPSIICWETSNEIIRRSLLLRRHEVSLCARAADPTRLVIDESGGSRAPWGAHAYLPYHATPLPLYDRHIYLRSPLSEADYQRLHSEGDADKVTFISEVGYGSFPDLPRNMARYERQGNPKTPDYKYHRRLLESLEGVMEKHHLRELFPDASALCQAGQELQAVGNKLQIEALRTDPKVDGYCLHAYTDGDWVLGAGVLDLWREPKRVYYAMQQVNRPLYLALRVTPQNVYAEQGATLAVTSVNDGPAASGELTVSVTDGRGQEVWASRQTVEIRPGIQSLLARPLDTGGLSGSYRLSARFSASARENSCDFLVFQAAELRPGVRRVATIDPQNQLRAFLAKGGVAGEPFRAGREETGPVVIATPDAWNEEQLANFVALLDFVKRGGTAIWLKTPSRRAPEPPTLYDDKRLPETEQLGWHKGRKLGAQNALIEIGVFPWDLHYRPALGHWIGVCHYTRRHPIFAGLPTGGLMGQPYRHAAPRNTLVDLDAPAVAGAVSWDLVEKNYLGPSTVWHGTDLAVLPYGRGKVILSTLEIVEFLGRDAVADKLLANMLTFAGPAGRLDPPPGDLAQTIDQSLARYRRWKADAAQKPNQ